MENQEKRVIEINGIKMEVDLRYAKEINNYKIGDQVKVLQKHYDSYKSYAGVIVGFDNFQDLPTIVIAYLDDSYGASSPLKFAYLNKESKDIEICPMIEKTTILEVFDKEIIKKQTEITELENKRKYFIKNFNMYFEEYKKDE